MKLDEFTNKVRLGAYESATAARRAIPRLPKSDREAARKAVLAHYEALSSLSSVAAPPSAAPPPASIASSCTAPRNTAVHHRQRNAGRLRNRALELVREMRRYSKTDPDLAAALRAVFLEDITAKLGRRFETALHDAGPAATPGSEGGVRSPSCIAQPLPAPASIPTPAVALAALPAVGPSAHEEVTADDLEDRLAASIRRLAAKQREYKRQEEELDLAGPIMTMEAAREMAQNLPEAERKAWLASVEEDNRAREARVAEILRRREGKPQARPTAPSSGEESGSARRTT